MSRPLANVNRGILYRLQRDARHTTAQEIGEAVGVSPGTVRNRIEHLETDGIIQGYHPKIDYEVANLPLRVLFVCTAPAVERANSSKKHLASRESSMCAKCSPGVRISM